MRAWGWLGCVVMLGLLLPGCQEQAPTPTRAGTAVPIFREYKGQQAPFPDRQFLVVQRAADWQALWSPRQAPEVDFAANSVLGVTLGQEATAGYEVAITDIRATGTDVIAYVDTLIPEPNTAVAQVVTYPYHFAVVPKITQPVTFTVTGLATPPIVLQDQYLGAVARATTAQTAVIRDAAAWRTFWVNSVGGATEPPAVDFAQYMAVAVFTGARSTTGYAVRIVGVTRSVDDRLSVQYRVTAPASGHTVSPTATSPYAIALVRASAMPVAFRQLPNVVIAAVQ